MCAAGSAEPGRASSFFHGHSSRTMYSAVNWDRTTSRVMTAEFYDACKLTDRAKLDEMGLSYKAVMDIALNFTSASIFRWGHMHSDIHPARPLCLWLAV